MGDSAISTGVPPVRPPGLRRFPKRMRLLRRREFLAVQRTGRKFHGRHFLAVMVPRSSAAIRGPLGANVPADSPDGLGDTSGHDNPGRIGITVSRKVGNAVIRNRIRRLVREYVRQHAWAPPGADVVIIAKHSAAGLFHAGEVATDLARIGSRLQRC